MIACRVAAGVLPAIALLAAAAPAGAVTTLGLVDFHTCANATWAIGGPVGLSAGNAGTADAKLGFDLLDPGTGANAWVGAGGHTLTVTLSVPSPTAVYALVNTLYGQSGVANVTFLFKASGGVHKAFNLVGNKTVRDFNNWVWTNSLVGTATQGWWTSNPAPKPNDQTHRIDAHRFALGAAFAGHTLTQIVVKAPKTAAVNFMEPLLFALGVAAPGAGGTVSSTCVTK